MRDRKDLLQVCMERGGFRKGALVAEFVMEWEICVRKHRRSVGVEEFAQWWKDSPRTAYRRLDQYREMFDLEDGETPELLMGPLFKRITYGEDDWQVLDATPLDLALVT